MPLPEFNDLGDLPAGVYHAGWHEVVERFVKPSALVGEQIDDFVAHWQVKRDGTKRGIVEVVW